MVEDILLSAVAPVKTIQIQRVLIVYNKFNSWLTIVFVSYLNGDSESEMEMEDTIKYEFYCMYSNTKNFNFVSG